MAGGARVPSWCAARSRATRRCLHLTSATLLSCAAVLLSLRSPRSAHLVVSDWEEEPTPPSAVLGYRSRPRSLHGPICLG